MYESHWGLREKPFENTPDPRFMYYSHEHLEAATRLTYAIKERKGAALLTGDYGCGKTIISRLIFEILPQDKYEIGLVTNPMLSSIDLLREICFELDIRLSPDSTKPQILKDLNNNFYENMNNDKESVIMIDEAHTIKDTDTFEELRLLLNFQLNERFLMTLVLIGQPELRNKIDNLQSFKQRISIMYHINPLSKSDTEKYIAHRLSKAGVVREIFLPASLKLIWERSEGIPRVINTICDMCLLTGFTRKLNVINEEVAKQIINDLGS
ncbi:MAG: ExeA family protein [Candidatus Aminicenantaceae bacterium]